VKNRHSTSLRFPLPVWRTNGANCWNRLFATVEPFHLLLELAVEVARKWLNCRSFREENGCKGRDMGFVPGLSSPHQEDSEMFRMLPLSVAVFVLTFNQSSLSQTLKQSATDKHSLAANKATRKADSKAQHSALSVVETIKLTGIDTGLILDGPQCDTEGNLYLRSDIDFQSPIHKLSLRGEKKADFLASSSIDLPHLPPELAHSTMDRCGA
jgi:hypothetical protein